MKISPEKTNQYNINNKKISNKGINPRQVVKTLANPDALASVIFLESFVSGGRSINAYKRGGMPEFRERLTDDVVSAIFWIKGVDMFNKLGDKVGKHILKLPETEFDVGKDALRTPFKNLVDNCTSKMDSAAAQKLERKLAAFKFTKIISSTLLATGFVGFVLPKINQFITDKIMNRAFKELKKVNKIPALAVNSFDEFTKLIDKKTEEKSNSKSFKGSSSAITTISHCLENNKICKMLTCDTGILTGRVLTARNSDEGREYFFRDATSSFFYFASTPLIYKSLQKLSGSANATSIDPVAAKQIYDVMSNQLKDNSGSFKSMNVEEFAQKTIGVIENETKEFIDKLPFKSDVISLNTLKEHVKDENILKKAAKMAELQPKQAGIGKVLTKQQVQDVFKNGAINDPKFMKKIFTERFGEALTNDYKFIPMKKITSFRENIEKYSQNVIKMAKDKNNGIVDKVLLDKINKRSFAMSSIFRFIALGCSAFALGFAIPKIQYAITERRTGNKLPPGLRAYNTENKTKEKK